MRSSWALMGSRHCLLCDRQLFPPSSPLILPPRAPAPCDRRHFRKRPPNVSSGLRKEINIRPGLIIRGSPKGQIFQKQAEKKICYSVRLPRKKAYHESVSCSVVSNSLRPRQAPLCIECSRKEYWSGLLFPSPNSLLHATKTLLVLFIIFVSSFSSYSFPFT